MARAEKPFAPDFLETQKKRLLKHKQEILNSMKSSFTNEEIALGPEHVLEEGDMAQATLSQNVALGLKEREVWRLKEIDEALMRIANGTYGFCEETGEPIGHKRLEKMPWTRLSIEAAEEFERSGVTRKAA
jgi:DnaK suppressor protein